MAFPHPNPHLFQPLVSHASHNVSHTHTHRVCLSSLTLVTQEARESTKVVTSQREPMCSQQHSSDLGHQEDLLGQTPTWNDPRSPSLFTPKTHLFPFISFTPHSLTQHISAEPLNVQDPRTGCFLSPLLPANVYGLGHGESQRPMSSKNEAGQLRAFRTRRQMRLAFPGFQKQPLKGPVSTAWEGSALPACRGCRRRGFDGCSWGRTPWLVTSGGLRVYHINCV